MESELIISNDTDTGSSSSEEEAVRPIGGLLFRIGAAFNFITSVIAGEEDDRMDDNILKDVNQSGSVSSSLSSNGDDDDDDDGDEADRVVVEAVKADTELLQNLLRDDSQINTDSDDRIYEISVDSDGYDLNSHMNSNEVQNEASENYDFESKNFPHYLEDDNFNEDTNNLVFVKLAPDIIGENNESKSSHQSEVSVRENVLDEDCDYEEEKEEENDDINERINNNDSVKGDSYIDLQRFCGNTVYPELHLNNLLVDVNQDEEPTLETDTGQVQTPKSYSKEGVDESEEGWDEDASEDDSGDVGLSEVGVEEEEEDTPPGTAMEERGAACSPEAAVEGEAWSSTSAEALLIVSPEDESAMALTQKFTTQSDHHGQSLSEPIDCAVDNFDGVTGALSSGSAPELCSSSSSSSRGYDESGVCQGGQVGGGGVMFAHSVEVGVDPGPDPVAAASLLLPDSCGAESAPISLGPIGHQQHPIEDAPIVETVSGPVMSANPLVTVIPEDGESLARAPSMTTGAVRGAKKSGGVIILSDTNHGVLLGGSGSGGQGVGRGRDYLREQLQLRKKMAASASAQEYSTFLDQTYQQAEGVSEIVQVDTVEPKNRTGPMDVLAATSVVPPSSGGANKSETSDSVAYEKETSGGGGLNMDTAITASTQEGSSSGGGGRRRDSSGAGGERAAVLPQRSQKQSHQLDPTTHLIQDIDRLTGQIPSSSHNIWDKLLLKMGNIYGGDHLLKATGIDLISIDHVMESCVSSDDPACLDFVLDDVSKLIELGTSLEAVQKQAEITVRREESLDVPATLLAKPEESTPHLNQTPASLSAAAAASTGDVASETNNIWISIAMEADSAMASGVDDSYWEDLLHRIRYAADSTRENMVEDEFPSAKVDQKVSSSFLDDSNMKPLAPSYPFESFQSPPWRVCPPYPADLYPYLNFLADNSESVYDKKKEMRLKTAEEDVRVEFALELTTSASKSPALAMTDDDWNALLQKAGRLVKSDKSFRMSFDHAVYELPGTASESLLSSSQPTSHSDPPGETNSTPIAGPPPESPNIESVDNSSAVQASTDKKKKKAKLKTSDLYKLIEDTFSSPAIANATSTPSAPAHETRSDDAIERGDSVASYIDNPFQREAGASTQLEDTNQRASDTSPIVLVTDAYAQSRYRAAMKEFDVLRKKKFEEQAEWNKARRAALLLETKLLHEQEMQRRLAELRKEESELEEYFRNSNAEKEKESERERLRRRAIEGAKARMRSGKK